MTTSNEAPMLPRQHSDPVAYQKIAKIVEDAIRLYRDNIDADAANAERAVTILLHCVELVGLQDHHPDEFREIKRSLGFGDGKRGTYNTSERPAREVVRLVLRFEKNRSRITRYAQALSHLLMVMDGEPDLAEYIVEKGGLNGCARAWREYKAEMKPAAESDQSESTAPEPTVETIPVKVPIKPTLCLHDPEGFVEEVPADLAATVIAQMLARRTVKIDSKLNAIYGSPSPGSANPQAEG